jgi:hypothetical protein
MNQFAEKIRAVELDVSQEKGPFTLFALLQHEEIQTNRWDFVVAAPWAKDDEPTMRYLDAAIKRHLEPAEMVLLARIVILDAADEPVRSINEKYNVEHGREELTNPALMGLPVKYGYIITSRQAA